MADLVTEAYPGINLLRDVLTYLKNLDEKWKIVGIRNRAADLLIEFADAKSALRDLRAELGSLKSNLREKDERIAEVGTSLVLKKKLMKHKDAYYEKDYHGKPSGDAFCLKCVEDVRPKFSHLVWYKGPKSAEHGYICTQCKTKHHNAKRIESAEQGGQM